MCWAPALHSALKPHRSLFLPPPSHVSQWFVLRWAAGCLDPPLPCGAGSPSAVTGNNKKSLWRVIYMQKDKGTFMHSRWPKAGGCYNADRVFCHARREGGTLLLLQHFRVLTQAVLQLLFYWYCTNVSCQLLSRRDHNLNRQKSAEGSGYRKLLQGPTDCQGQSWDSACSLSTNRAPWSLLLMG